MQLSQNNILLTRAQKEQVVRWWLPPLSAQLKKRHKAPVLYVKQTRLPIQKALAVFRGAGVCFPLPALNPQTQETLGVLIVMSALKQTEIHSTRRIIKEYFNRTGLNIKQAPLPLEGTKQTLAPPAFRSYENKHYNELEFRPHRTPGFLKSKPCLNAVKTRGSAPCYFIHLEQEAEVIKKAHQLFARSHCFAFVLLSELKWEEKLLEKLKNVFICVPAFHKLSYQQKHQLKKALKGRRAAVVAIGRRGKLKPGPKHERFFKMGIKNKPIY